MSELKPITGGITAVNGISASGVSCGIKGDGKSDLALIVSRPPAVAAGLFTSNFVVSPSVVLCKENLKAGQRVDAVIINSGNANACTGDSGFNNAREVARLTSAALGVEPDSVLIASTGIIGVRLPMDLLRKGIPEIAENLSPDGGKEAAEAIMTTDLQPKERAVEYEFRGKTITVGGMAKGSGMIQPNMATMLAFVATDAAVDKGTLQAVLGEVADKTFNSITVDGETSTNDTLLCLANGTAGNEEIQGEGEGLEPFREALGYVCLELAKAVVRDGEGATKFLEITVSGTKTVSEAEKIARNIANSMLVKAAFFGKDPNWGRIVSAAGSAGVAFDPDELDLDFGHIAVMKGGRQAPDADSPDLKEIMDKREIKVHLKVGKGEGRATLFTTDLSYEYVRINSEYTS